MSPSPTGLDDGGHDLGVIDQRRLPVEQLVRGVQAELDADDRQQPVRDAPFVRAERTLDLPEGIVIGMRPSGSQACCRSTISGVALALGGDNRKVGDDLLDDLGDPLTVVRVLSYLKLKKD